MASSSLANSGVYSQELPSGGHVTHGAASIANTGSGLLIEQATENAIINWGSFSIGAGGTVDFRNGSGATLNRVTGSDLSRIDGSLFGSGDVYLINQNGVVVGSEGVVRTGGTFVASTLDVTNSDFLNGGDLSFAGDADTSVVNLGSVSSSGGNVAMIAHSVVNQGSVSAPNGTAALVSGREVLMRDAALDDGLFSVRVGAAGGSVTEQGMMEAAAVELRAAGGNVYALAGNTGDAINATGVAQSGGRVFLTAGGGHVVVNKPVQAHRVVTQPGGSAHTDGGDIFINADLVDIAGLLDVSSPDGPGGHIDIGGKDIALTGATLDASGALGGGQIRVGGAYQGGDFGDLMTATTTSVDAQSLLTASAIENGDGGEVIVWANGTTLFDGTIKVAGGADGGDGGLAETSGKERLWVGQNAYVNALAPNGIVGDWLLDPKTITVATGGAATLADAADSTDTTSEITIAPGTINAAAANVTLWASETITFSNAVSMTNAGVGLTARAGDLVTVNADVATNNGDISFIADEYRINAAVDAGTGTMMFDTVAENTMGIGLNVGTGTAGADLDKAELARITAGDLIIGNPDAAENHVTELLVTSFPASANITGRVQYNALGSGNAYILSKGDQTYASVEFNANDGVEFQANQTLTTTVGSAVFNVDADATGRVGGFDDLHVDSGYAVVINSAADIAVTTPLITALGTLDLDAAGNISIARSNAGTIGLGDGASGGLSISDAQLGRMTAASLTIGDTTNTTAINVDGGNWTGLGDLTLTTTGTGAVQLTDATENYSFGSLAVNTGTTTVGADITTTGAQTYNAAVSLGSDSTFASTGGGDIAFGSTINGAFGLTVDTDGMTTFNGAIGGTTALSSLTTDAAGATEIGAGTIDVDGNTTTFNDVVTLTADLTINDTGDVYFGNLVRGNFDLTVDSGDTVTFREGVGDGASGTFPTALTVNATNIAAWENFRVSGAILLNGAVTLNTDASTGFGKVSFAGTDVRFVGSVDGGTMFEVLSARDTFLDATVGTIDPVASISFVPAPTASNDPNAIYLGGGPIIAQYGQTYGSVVELTADTTMEVLESTGRIQLPIIAGPYNLTLDTLGEVYFGGGTGGMNYFPGAPSADPLTGLTVTGGGTTYAQASYEGLFKVDGNASFGGPLVLESDLTMDIAGNATFGGTVDGAFGLTVNAVGDTIFGGAIGGTTALTSLATGAGGMTYVNGGYVETTGNTQTYNDDVVLGMDTTIIDGGNVTFNGTVDSASTGYYNLNIDADGTTTFAGKVGGTRLLNEIDIDSDTGIAVNGGLVASTGTQTYKDAVDVAGTVFASTAGSLGFNAGVTTTLPNSDVWFLAADDLRFGGSAQWGGTGNMTLVAGWNAATDGSTGWTLGGTTADTSILDNAGNYGLGTGDISIGTSTQTSGISVGSRDGTTTALAQNLYIVSSNADNGYAQLGFRGAATGDIDVKLTEDLTTLTLSGLRAFVQLGHGGYGDNNSHSGDISIEVGENVFFGAGGGARAYAQLGHGGFVATGSHSGAIDINAGGYLDFTGGSGSRAYAQLGHGGFLATGSHSGAIDINAVGNLTFTGGSGFLAYAQLGHGDASGNAGGTRMGDISAIVGGQTNLTANTSGAWFGHATTAGGGISNADVALVTNGLSVTGGDFAGMIRNNLAGGDMLIANRLAADTGSTLDDIIFDGTSNFGSPNSPFALTLATGGELHMLSAYQNHGSGDVNLVAGWDGATGLDLTGFPMLDMAQIEVANAFGAAGGDINIGDGLQTTGIAVGSSGGTTTALARDLNITASGTADGFAQLGFEGAATGDIGVRLTQNLTAMAGDAFASYAQLGHGGYDADGSHSGAITIDADGNLTFTGGGTIAYAQLGHGGLETVGDHSGAIDLTVGGNLDFTGGETQAYAQLGHGGYDANGNHSGDIAIDANGNLTFTGGGTQAYSQLGHGGFVATGSHSGTIDINAGGYLDFTGGETQAYAQLGHGGHLATDSHSGAIDINAGGYLDFTGGGTQAYAQLGHGGYDGDGDHSGAVTIDAGGDLTFTGGLSQFAYAQLGHGGAFADGDHSGAITVDADGNLTFTGGGTFAYAQLGHGGYDSDGNHSGNITIDAVGDLSFMGGAGTQAYSQLGHGGYDADGDHFGDITIDAGGNLIFTGGGTQAYARIGHGGYLATGNHSGAIDLTAGGSLTVAGGVGTDAYAQLGHGGYDADGDHLGDITIDAGGNLIFTGGSTQAYAQIGHGGVFADGNHSGNITIDADGDLSFLGGSGSASYVQLGNGGYLANGTHSGAITINAVGDLSFTGGGGTNAFTQLGHGGAFAFGSHSGAVAIDAGGSLNFTGGMGLRAYAQLGHGGAFAFGSHSGAVAIDAGGSLNFTGGTGLRAYAQLGHGDASGNTSGTRMGNISAIVGGLTTLTASTGGYWFGHATTTGGGVSDANVALVTNGLSINGGDFAGMLQYDLLGGNVLIANRLAAATPDAGGFANQGTDDIIFDGSNFGYLTSDFDLTLAAGGDIVMLSGVRNQGAGNINLAGGWDGTTGLDLSGFPMFDMDMVETAGAFGVTGGDVYVGDGSQTQEVDVGSRQGDIHVLAHDLEVTGGDVDPGSGARLGFRTGPVEGIDSDIRIVAMDDVLVEGGDANFTSAAIGHDGVESSGTILGDITIVNETGNDNVLAVSGGDGNSSYAQIGHESCCGGADAGISITGEDVVVEGGDGEAASARIGHNANSLASGEIDILASNDLEILGGAGEDAYAQIGHYADQTATGVIRVVVQDDLMAFGGTGFDAYSQIGHIGDTASGLIDVDVSESALVVGGIEDGAETQIGHNSGTLSSSDILFDAGEDLTIAALVPDAASYVGHSGIGDATGNIGVTVGENLIVTTIGSGTSAQIGHVASDNNSGDIAVDVSDTLSMGNTVAGSYSKIGHGGPGSDMALAGDILVDADGQIILYGNLSGAGFSQIGHGDPFGSSTGARQGNITVETPGQMTLDDGPSGDSLAWVGHGTGTAGGISNADVFLQAFGFDRDILSNVPAGDLGAFNKDMLVGNIVGGDFTLIATGTGLLLEDPAYNSPHQLLVSVNNDLVLDTNATFTNTGAGNIILAAGGDFHNDTGSLTPITTGGRWLVYSTRPDNNRNDIEITNWDFLRYSSAFDINDVIPAGLPHGGGLIYSVTPVYRLNVADLTIDYGRPLSLASDLSLTVNGVAVAAPLFGPGASDPSRTLGLAGFVPLDAAGNPLSGSHDNGLISTSFVVPYFGMGLLTVPGDLVVNEGTNPNTTTPQIGDATVLAGETCPYVQELDEEEEQEDAVDTSKDERLLDFCQITDRAEI